MTHTFIMAMKFRHYYDSMLAKIISLAGSRKSAIKRMLSALDEFFIEGINTTHQFHQKMLKDEKFIKNQTYNQLS